MTEISSVSFYILLFALWVLQFASFTMLVLINSKLRILSVSIETTLVKRPALYVGEVGFFPTNAMAADDIAPAKMGGEVVCSFYSPRNLEALKFLWALVHKTADNSDRWLDKDEAMEDLKMRARFARFVVGADGKVELRPKSLKRISDEALRLLTDKIMDIICQEILPNMKKNDLRKEIELMLGGKR